MKKNRFSEFNKIESVVMITALELLYAVINESLLHAKSYDYEVLQDNLVMKPYINRFLVELNDRKYNTCSNLKRG